jgi:uncharacterized protein (DUF2252 family)
MIDDATRRISPPQRNPDFRFHPARLSGKYRGRHVVDSLLYYNAGLIAANPAGATEKFSALANSPFAFLRGTADLMYRDLEGSDANMTLVLCMGDVHVENFGVMESDAGLIWGLNDYDEAEFAPFTWDVKRGATSVVLVAKEHGLKTRAGVQLAESFATAYLKTIAQAIGTDAEERAQFTGKLGPKMIRKLIKKAASVDRHDWLAEYLQPNSTRFRETDEIDPKSACIEAAQEAINAYLPTLHGVVRDPPQQIRVLDVATKTGSGLGSIGLWRYYWLVEAVHAGGAQQLILEAKQERPSVLQPYVGKGHRGRDYGSDVRDHVDRNLPFLFASHGSRVAYAENVHLPNANPYYGYTSLYGISYLVRQRSPRKRGIKLNKLKGFREFQTYVDACGSALAAAHARSDRVVSRDQLAESRIWDSINRRTFADDIAHFAATMSRQVKSDWKAFCKSQAAGEFTFAATKDLPSGRRAATPAG